MTQCNSYRGVVWTGKAVVGLVLSVGLVACDDAPDVSSTQGAITTTKRGMDYVEECRAAGVPVPDRVLEPSLGWVNLGIMPFSFISDPSTSDSELWSWESSDPEGVCLALPRWSLKAPNLDEASLLG